MSLFENPENNNINTLENVKTLNEMLNGYMTGKERP